MVFAPLVVTVGVPVVTPVYEAVGIDKITTPEPPFPPPLEPPPLPPLPVLAVPLEPPPPA